MKTLLLLLIFVTFLSFGQDQTISAIACGTTSIATYSGGISKMNAFIFDNFNIPQDTTLHIFSEKIWVEFTIYEDGSVNEVKVTKGLSDQLNKEAIRVVSTMPNWTPSYSEGTPTKTTYTLPITLNL